MSTVLMVSKELISAVVYWLLNFVLVVLFMVARVFTLLGNCFEYIAEELASFLDSFFY